MRDFALIILIVVVFHATRLACGAQIQGEFRPEKQKYLVGEPVFVVLDLTNPTPQPVWISMSCEWLDTRFEAPTAPKPHRQVGLFGCVAGGTAGSCGGSAKEVRPGEHITRRYFLAGDFRLDAPGYYPIRAWHKVGIYSGGTGFQIVSSQDVVSEFDLTLIDGTDEELASAYAPIIRDLRSTDSLTAWLARSAVVDNPPRFLENLILAMADDPKTASHSIPGLKHLATLRAKDELAKLSASGNPEYIRQMAIEALGGLGDPAYCSVMLDIARESGDYSRFIALRAAGYLCGDKVLPLLTNQLSNADHSPRFEAAYAMGNSHSRQAVPLLITLLLDPDDDVRRAARDSLATLTHRSLNTDQRTALREFHDWTSWWASNRMTAPIYGIDECKEPEPLP